MTIQLHDTPPIYAIVQNDTPPIIAAGEPQPFKRRLIIVQPIKRRFYISAQYQCVSRFKTIKTAVKIKAKLKPIKGKLK